ncbi:MAG: hypothetical protein ACFFDN_40375 [Candidatus Hodarchaeota archaeon]
MLNYYMSRYTTDTIYTFELFVVIILFLVLIILWKQKGEKNSLLVYFITGILHSIIELVAEGTGTRVISTTYLFGIFQIGYPFTAFILGFFEGGLFCLMGYHIVRILMNRDSFSLKFTSILSIIFLTFSTLGAINTRMSLKSNPFVMTITRREIFSIGAIILLIISFVGSFGYFFLKKNIPSEHKISLIYFYLGVIFFTAVLTVPLHLLGVRFIEVYQNFVFMYASFIEQIIVMYGYSIVLEAAGFFLPFYVIIYHFNLIELE